MKTRNLFISRDEMAIPGPADDRSPQILYQLIKDLAPGLLGQACLLTMIKTFIFVHTLGAQSPAPSQCELHDNIKAYLPSGHQADLDLLIDVLEGMQAVAEHYCLRNPHDLDQWLAADQAAFAEWLQKHQGSLSAGKGVLPLLI